MELGHGDEIVIADGNFPALAHAKRVVRLDGHGTCEILEAIMSLFPLDMYVQNPINLMEVVKGDTEKPTIWAKYAEIIKNSGEKFSNFNFIERFAFYERAKGAYATITSSEKVLYANILLSKGVV